MWEEYNLAIASGGGTPTPTRGATAPATPTEYDSGENSLDMWVNAWGTGDVNIDAEYVNEQCDSHDWREWPLDITRQYCRVCGIDEGVED
jgi:hypothetical protein